MKTLKHALALAILIPLVLTALVAFLGLSLAGWLLRSIRAAMTRLGASQGPSWARSPSAAIASLVPGVESRSREAHDFLADTIRVLGEIATP